MEFSAGFDSISSMEMGSDRDTRFGDRIGFAIRRALYESGGFSFGVPPKRSSSCAMKRVRVWAPPRSPFTASGATAW